MTVDTTYIARDHRMFNNEQDCRDYEKFLDVTERVSDKYFVVNEFHCERTVTVYNEGVSWYSYTSFKKGEDFNGRDIYQALSKLLKPRDYVKYYWTCKKVPADNGKITMYDVYIEYEIEKPCYLIDTSGGKDLRFPCIPKDAEEIEAYRKKNPNEKLFDIHPCRTSFAQILLTEVGNKKGAGHLKLNEDVFGGAYLVVNDKGEEVQPDYL